MIKDQDMDSAREQMNRSRRVGNRRNWVGISGKQIFVKLFERNRLAFPHSCTGWPGDWVGKEEQSINRYLL